MVEVGAEVKLRQGNDEKTVTIEKISDTRRGAPEAQLLYQETAQSIELRERHAQMRKLNAFDSPSPIKRPDKKQRRDIMRFKNINTSHMMIKGVIVEILLSVGLYLMCYYCPSCPFRR